MIESDLKFMTNELCAGFSRVCFYSPGNQNISVGLGYDIKLRQRIQFPYRSVFVILESVNIDIRI